MSGRAGRRWAHVTYASFRNAAGRGGWHVGPSVNADPADEQTVTEHAPTSLVHTHAFDDFISKAEIEKLPRRFEYLPLGETGLMMQSVPAGTDATGRPGNVFTHAVVDHDLSAPLSSVYPINLYRSPDLLTPFRVASVNAVELEAGLEEPRPGPLADLAVAWLMVSSMMGDRTGSLHQLQDLISEGRQLPVLVAKNGNEAVYWLQALSSTLAPAEARRLLRFSTFERAASLPVFTPGSSPQVVVVPAQDLPELRQRTDVRVVDIADPATHTTSPESTWARLSSGVFGSSLEPTEIVAGLDTVTADLDAAQLGALGLGDGLARFVRANPTLFDAALAEVAEQHLAGRAAARQRPAAPAAPAVPAGPTDVELELVRRVIGRPELARTSGSWPVLEPGPVPEPVFFQLVDEVFSSLDGLRDRDVDTVVGYLDFLLHTGLLSGENLTDPAVTGKISVAPALRRWREKPLPWTAHPALPGLLLRAESRRTADEETARARAEDRSLLPLSSVNSIGNILLWLGQERVPAQLRRALDTRFIYRSGRDYAPDLLRVYYTVNIFCQIEPIITGEREHDGAVALDLASLTLAAVIRHVQTTGGGPARFRRLGRQIARDDIHGASRDPSVMEEARAEFLRHQNPDLLEFSLPPGVSDAEGAAVKEIFVAVARGITEELGQQRKDNH